MTYEYLIVRRGPNMADTLSEYGSQGWRLVCVTGDHAYLERSADDQPTHDLAGGA